MTPDKILAFLRNNALAVFLAIVPPLGIWYFTQRDTRGLAVTITADVPIVTVDRQFADGIDVRYRGTQVSTLRVVEVSLRNSGNKSLARNDFDGPLTFGFQGQLLGAPSIVRRVPRQLPVALQAITSDSIRLIPLLLNASDELAFRVLVANTPGKQSQVSVTGRVMGVKEISVTRDVAAEANPASQPDWLAMIGAVLAAAVSVGSAARLVRKGYDIKIATAGTGLALELAKRIIATPADMDRVQSLAKELGIAQHDYKSNILLLRLKIESQLRDLARAARLSDREQIGSMHVVARSLGARRVLAADTVRLISALARPMNRELHELDSFLSDDECDSLQRAALDVVATLDAIRKGMPPSADV